MKIRNLSDIREEQFIKMPSWLFADKFKDLSIHAIVLYSILRDEQGLSLKNGFQDEIGAFQFMEIDRICELLRCGRDKAVATKRELSVNGLLIEKRQGMGKANKLYLRNITEVGYRTPEVGYRTPEVGYRTPEVGKTVGNQTEYNHTEFNHTEYSQTENGSDSVVVVNSNIDMGPEDGQEPPTGATTTAKPQEGLGEVIRYYERATGRFVSPRQMETIQMYLTQDAMEPELLKAGIDEMTDSKTPSFKYLESILTAWAQRGVKTLAKRYEEQQEYASSKRKNGKIDFEQFAIR